MVPRPAIPARVVSSVSEQGDSIKLEKPVSVLSSNSMVPNPQVFEPSENTSFGPQQDPGKLVIDLTEEPDEDLQKAIALSLQDEQDRSNTSFVTQEQADIDRAVAASISENSRRRHVVTLRETTNPNERIRQGDWPVGLKNVGNSCWFSAVIQSLFYIPEFRRLVLRFDPHKIVHKELDQRDQRNVTLITNLRKLFALMISGTIKYLDPSDCISILKSGLGDSFSQHDVSETTHLLLEWLEEAFSLWNRRKLEEEGIEKGQMELESETKGESSTCYAKNPLIDLFYGQMAVESTDGSSILSRLEQFSQLMIQVSGMSDLHQGIEASTKESVEPSPLTPQPSSQTLSPTKSQSSQSYKVLRSLGMIRERWFQDLPPVLTFELNRFRYNGESQRSEKIHNRVRFPRRIFMDRYLKENKELTVEIRAAAEELTRRKVALEEQIKSYEEYGSESQKHALPRVLRYAKQFVETRKLKTSSNCDQHIPSTSNTSNAVKTQLTVSSGRRRSLSELESEPMDVDHDSKRRRYLTDDEYRLISSCLEDLHEEVCLDLEQFSKEVARLDTKIETIYDRPELQKVPYILHAVMVHGGEAASGHYWSYIWDENRHTWLKFNDHLVTEVSWTDLEKDAYGGPHTKASAYCLIYLDEKRKDTLLGSNIETNLPEDLVGFVQDETRKFDEEIRSWEDKQKEHPMEVQEVPVSQDGTTQVEDQPGTVLDINKWEVVPLGSSFEIERTNLERAYEENSDISPAEAWSKFYQNELSTYQQIRRSSVKPDSEDPRAMNFVCYLAANDLMGLVPFSCLVLISRCLGLICESTDLCLPLQELASVELEAKRRELTEREVKELISWNKSYRDFLVDVHGFIYAVECIGSKKMYDQCVPILARIFLDGQNDRALGPKRRISSSAILRSLRICLQPLSNFYIEQFRQSDSGGQLANEIQMTLVPGIVVLSQSADESDARILEQIRNDWCGLLNDGIDESQMERILQLLLDCRESPDLIKNLPSTPIHRQSDLHRVFNDALRYIESSEC